MTTNPFTEGFYKKQLPIDVKQRHINYGKPTDPDQCAISKAVKEELTNKHIHFRNVFTVPCNINLNHWNVVIDYGGSMYFYALSGRANKFVVDFDFRKTCKPSKFFAKRVL